MVETFTELYNSITKYDAEEAKSVLAIIKSIAKLKDFPMPHHDPYEIGKTETLQQYLQWYSAHVRQLDDEDLVIKILGRIESVYNERLKMIEEGCKRLIKVSAEKEKTVMPYKEDYKIQQAVINKLKEKIIELQSECDSSHKKVEELEQEIQRLQVEETFQDSPLEALEKEHDEDIPIDEKTITILLDVESIYLLPL